MAVTTMRALAMLAAFMSALAFAQEPQTVEGETFVPITPDSTPEPELPNASLAEPQHRLGPRE